MVENRKKTAFLDEKRVKKTDFNRGWGRLIAKVARGATGSPEEVLTAKHSNFTKNSRFFAQSGGKEFVDRIHRIYRMRKGWKAGRIRRADSRRLWMRVLNPGNLVNSVTPVKNGCWV